MADQPHPGESFDAVGVATHASTSPACLAEHVPITTTILVISALIKATPDFLICEAFLQQGADLDVKVFLDWFEASKAEGRRGWMDKRDTLGNTPLHLALYG
eukprot:gene12401-31874_t